MTLASEWNKPIRQNEKRLVVQQLARWCNGQGCGAPSPRGEDPFPAGPRALLCWFQSGRKGLGSCNRFEKLNKQLLTANFEVIQKHFF